MRILVINQYASTPKYSSGAGERHFYIANELKNVGIETTIIASSHNHLLNKLPDLNGLNCVKEEYHGVKFYWLKGRKYSPESGLGRLYSWLEFLVRLFFIRNIKKPDVVVVSSMSIFPAIFAAYLKLRYKCRFILEIRDIWPLTLTELGNFKKYHPAILLLKIVERFAYKRADLIVSVYQVICS